MRNWWWDGRRMGEPTADYLARVLSDLGATELAEKARALHFDDFRCPRDAPWAATPTHYLVRMIGHWAGAHPEHAQRAAAMVNAAKLGEFEATEVEAQDWLDSPDGKAALARMVGGGR